MDVSRDERIKLVFHIDATSIQGHLVSNYPRKFGLGDRDENEENFAFDITWIRFKM